MSKRIEIKYFVLNPSSTDAQFAAASRAAMRKFADVIAAEGDKEFANDIRDWADGCSPVVDKLC